jgi:hypothetical protein
MMRDHGSVVQPAVDVDKLLAEARRVHIAASDAERAVEVHTKRAAELRLQLGRILVDARKGFPRSGPKAAGWARFIADIGIASQRASEYMRLAGHVDSGDLPAGGEISSLRSAGIKPGASDARPTKAPAPRVVRDGSQDPGEEDVAEDRSYREVTFPVESAPAPPQVKVATMVQVGDGPITTISTTVGGEVRDQLGRDVPAALRPAFVTIAPRLKRLHQLLLEAAREWDAMEADLRAARSAGAAMPPGHPFAPFGASVKDATVLRDLALSYLRALPYTSCPTCHGGGTNCADCRGAGWADKARFDRALPAAKEAAGQ